MNKHEVEALRGLVDKFKEEADYWRREKHTGFARGHVICASDLEKLLDSLPAPDDGLCEGLEKLLDRWADKAVKFLKGKDADCVRHETIKDCIDEAEELLAKTPDPWKPIADAPRDGREIIGWFIAGGKGREDFIKWDASVLVTGMWKNRYGHYWGDACFDWWREKHSPPREGKE